MKKPWRRPTLVCKGSLPSGAFSYAIGLPGREERRARHLPPLLERLRAQRERLRQAKDAAPRSGS